MKNYWLFVVACFWICLFSAPIFGQIRGDESKKKKDKLLPEIVLVEGGEFPMGSGYGEIDEEPVHKVRLSDYYIGRYEVTNDEYCAFLNLRLPGKRELDTWINTTNDNFDIQKAGKTYFVVQDKGSYPVTQVSWYGASAYCEWLRQLTGEPYRMPTEAEWEFAARGGRKTHQYVYAGSKDVGEVAWFAWNSEKEKHEIGTLKQNELTLYDMNGNVQEWCNDWYGEKYYEEMEIDGPSGPEKGHECVVRGGSWNLEMEYTRNEDRNKYSPNNKSTTIGFRVAKDGSKSRVNVFENASK